MNNNEKDIQELINKFSQQQSSFAPRNQGSTAGEDNSFLGNNPVLNKPVGLDSHSGIDNQGSINNSTPIKPGTISPAAGPSPIPTGNECPQCGMMHPPLRSGEKCPNAAFKAMSEESEDFSLDIRRYLANLQNILMSQIDKKGIKDVKKLFQNITIEITKYLEGYKE